MTGALASLLFASKVGLYAAALLAIGVSLHIALGVIDRRPSARWIAPGAALAAVALALIRLVLTSAQLGDLATTFAPSTLALAWMTQGLSVSALALGAVAAVVAAKFDARTLYGAAAFLLAASFALTGHAQGVTNPMLTPIGVAAHVLVAGFWFAAPFALWPASGTEDGPLAARLERFSATATIAIPILFVLGVVLLLRLAGSAHAVFQSDYGRLLLAKLAAATGALALGAHNKFILTKEVRAAKPRARSRLQISLLLEAAAFTTALLLLAGATTLTGPDA